MDIEEKDINIVLVNTKVVFDRLRDGFTQPKDFPFFNLCVDGEVYTEMLLPAKEDK
jgi:hypothetical protein